jgi:hypothetical protein
MDYGFSYPFTQNIEILHPNINIFDSSTNRFAKKKKFSLRSLHGVSVYLNTVYDICCRR